MKIEKILFTVLGLLAVIALICQACTKEEEKTNNHPSCNITSPSEGDIFVQGAIVTVSVNASDTDGSIAKVLFFVDDVEKSSASSSPYDWDWDTSGENIGNHTIKATSTDNEGATARDEVTIVIIQATPPESAFKAFPTCGVPPFSVDFTDQSTNDPTGWQWDFGDGNTSTQTNPSHTYNADGSYTVTLTVTNSYGSDTETKTNCINVSDNGCFDTFTDPRDGQTYDIVTIGEQIWFAENLNYETENSWCYDDNSDNCDMYGRLYKWQNATVACPTGWHLASDEEWKTLEMNLGMSQSEADDEDLRGTDEGHKLKSISGWTENNGTDVVGFTGLPGGERTAQEDFTSIGNWGFWWTSTEVSDITAWKRDLSSNDSGVWRVPFTKKAGASVRCVKNN